MNGNSKFEISRKRREEENEIQTSYTTVKEHRYIKKSLTICLLFHFIISFHFLLLFFAFLLVLLKLH
jgi:hypothetical protein